MRFASAVILALVAAGARASGMEEQAARSYVLETAGSTAALAAGERGVLVLAIRPEPGVHVQAQAPVKVTLQAPPGVTPAKTKLALADAVDPRAHAPRFEVAFTADAPGSLEVKARLEFFVCSDRWCVRQQRDIAWPVEVAAAGNRGTR